jgi:CheY-like chemotaxis protein
VTAQKTRILYVDDEKEILNVMRMSLEFFGYEVLAVDQPKRALHLFSGAPDRFDLVITDFSMPEMNGDQLAIELLKMRPDIPILFCSGMLDMNAEKAHKLGGCGYLQKPVKGTDLAKTVHSALQKTAIEPL